MNQLARLSAKANEQPDAKAFIEGKTRLTYGEARDRIGRLSAWFADLPLSRGDRVILASEHDQEVALLFLAMVENGLVPVVTGADITGAKFGHLATLTAARGVIADRPVLERCLKDDGAVAPERGYLTVAIEPRKGQGKLLDRLLGRGAPKKAEATTYPALLDNYSPRTPAGATFNGPAYILPTSGSTSSPKAVQVGTRALVSHLHTLEKVFGYDERTKMMNLLPFHHADGLVHGAVAVWFAGGTLLRPFRFSLPNIEPMMHRIYGDEVTHLVMVPTMLSLVLRFGKELTDTFSGAKFRGIASTAGKLDASLWQQFEEHFKVRVTNIFGLTETVTAGLFSGPDDASHRYGTIGRGVDCETRVVREDGSEAPQGEPGELWIRGDLVFDGYVNQPEVNAQVLVDGWLRTGDLVARDADGLLRFCGRLKNVIVCGGENIYPEEVTEVLATHPEVREAVTFGMPDPEWEEVPVALIVASAGLKPEALQAWAAERLSARMVPRQIRVVEALPYGPSGKVRLDEARRMFGEAQAGAASGDAQVAAKLRAIAAKCFRVAPETLTPASGPHNTPGWDSLAHIGFSLEIENTFGIALSAAEIMNLQNLEAAEQIVRARHAA